MNEASEREAFEVWERNQLLNTPPRALAWAAWKARAAVPAVQPTSDLPARVLAMCKARGWSLHWTHRGAYLHLEASELIEALRGKRGDPLGEAADVLLVLMSITESNGLAWDDVLAQCVRTVEKLEVAPRYKGEEFAAAPQAEARQEQPKQPDSSYSAQPKGEEATERNALAEFNPKLSVVERISLEYPFERDRDVSDALRGWKVREVGPKNADGSIQYLIAERAALSSTPAQGDGGTGGGQEVPRG